MAVMLYFAYGSNMHPGQMERRCPGCAFVATARLKDHRLAFSRFWKAWGGGGVADILPAPGGVVEGVVWEISEAHRQTLDDYEEYPTSYSRRDVVVETADRGALTAFAYVAQPTGDYRPSRRYLQQILDGARAHHLSPDYLAFLESIPTED
jgi:cation transport regulator ChaC